jgi:polysaccharide transporter, PST family
MSAPPSASDAPAPAAPIRAGSLAEGVLILFALTIVQRIVGFVRGVWFCRSLDADQLGQWDLAFSFMMLAAPLAVLGLPGSFGRYAETYRGQGLLRMFLRRTGWATLIPSVAFCVAMAAAAPWVSQLVFDSREQTSLVLAMAAALGGFIAFNYLTSLFVALRSTRIVSLMQFSNTLLFAGAGFLLLDGRGARAEMAVAAFGLACFISAAVALVWMVRLWRELPKDEPFHSQHAMWSRLMPFAFWVWVINWVSNSFEIADRYMIVHFSGRTHEEALSLVGEYHSARVIPALILGLAELLGALATPHLVRDWEAGRRDVVDARLRMILKTFVLAFVGGSVLLLFASPLFFHFALGDKFGVGRDLFPWALACSLWTGIAVISHNWLWCAERSRLVTIGMAIGLAANVGLNLVLLPRYGLGGVVIAASVGKLTMMTIDLGLCRAFGMKFDRGLFIAGLLPGLLILGAWPAAAATLIVASGFIRPLSLFDAAERRQLAEAYRGAVARLRSLVDSRRPGPAAARSP